MRTGFVLDSIAKPDTSTILVFGLPTSGHWESPHIAPVSWGCFIFQRFLLSSTKPTYQFSHDLPFYRTQRL